jgi:hypothetical protein
LTHRIGFRTIKAITKVICGDSVNGSDAAVSPYRTSRLLDEFFLEDLALEPPQAFTSSSRESSTETWLKAFNGTGELARIIEASVRPADYAASGYNVGEAAVHLNLFLIHDGLQLVRMGDRFVLRSLAGVQMPEAAEAKDVLSDAYVQELAAKCDGRLAASDYDGAITTARTLLEAILVGLEARLAGSRGEYKGDLPKQFKQVTKLLRMDDERPDLDDRFKDVIRGLVMVVNGLAPLRNKMSDGHARERKPAPHHARVVVNASKTVATFLVESYAFQVDKGLLTASLSDTREPRNG